jgi:hypothetical protein
VCVRGYHWLPQPEVKQLQSYDPHPLFVTAAQSAFALRIENLSRISLFGFLERQGAVSQVIVIILTLSDAAEAESREEVMQLRVLISQRQLAIGQFLLA